VKPEEEVEGIERFTRPRFGGSDFIIYEQGKTQKVPGTCEEIFVSLGEDSHLLSRSGNPFGNGGFEIVSLGELPFKVCSARVSVLCLKRLAA